MPHRCCVPKCSGNYDNGPKVSSFSCSTDPDLRNKWLLAIKRDDFTPSNSSKRVRKRNEELKKKHKKLQNENTDLTNRFQENQVEIITGKNDLNNLLEELQKEKRANLETAQRLQIRKEHIETINTFISDLRPLKEQLSFKKNVEECLHNMLIKTKLSVAEGEDLLQDMHDQLTELEHEVEKTRIIQRKTVSQWQEEFLSARLREADLVLEFDKIKRATAYIKHSLEDRKLIRSLIGDEEESNKIIPFKKGDKMVEQLKGEEQQSISNTVQLQNEIDHLKSQIKHLEEQKEDCLKRVFFNEEIKVNLQEVKRSIWSREYETSKKIDKIREEYKKLNEKMTLELDKIQKSVEEKDKTITELGLRIKELQNDEIMPTDIKDEKEQEQIDKLVKKQSLLEEAIKQLKRPQETEAS